jgi:hypothetical protein
LQNVYASDEFFWDLDHKQFNQNRLTPLGLSIRLGDHAQLRVFYVLQSTRAHAEWECAHALGTHLQFRLK